MTVGMLEEFLKTVSDKSKSVYFYCAGDDPFNDANGIENAFEVSRDIAETGMFEGVYIKGN